MTLPNDGGPLTIEGVRLRRIPLVQAGFSFFPEITGRKQSIKSVGSWHGKCGTFDPNQDYKNQFGSLFNDALYCDGLFAFDVDVDDPHWAGEITKTMDRVLGKALCRRYRPGSPRTLSLYRAPPEALYTALKGSDGTVEVFTGENDKVGAFGLHTNKTTGIKTRMQWDGVPGNIRKADLPLISIEQRDKFLEEISEMLGDAVVTITRQSHNGTPGNLLADDIDELYKAALFLPNGPSVDWKEWCRIGMALFAGSGGSDIGLAAFVAWTAKCPGASVSHCAERWIAWASCPPTRIGARTIFRLALQNGYQPPTMSPADTLIWRAEQTRKARAAAFKFTI